MVASPEQVANEIPPEQPFAAHATDALWLFSQDKALMSHMLVQCETSTQILIGWGHNIHNQLKYLYML